MPMLNFPMLNTIVLAAGNPADHVYNHVFARSASGWWLWSGNQGNLVLSGLILIVGGLWAAGKIKTGPASEGTDAYLTKRRLAHLVEVLCVYLRDEIARPLLKDRTDKLMPFLWTIFFFILVNNLLGLVPIMDTLHLLVPSWAADHRTPIGGTATQNIWVTAVLAVAAAIVFNGAAIARLGVGGYMKHLTADAPWFVWPIIVPIEFLGQVAIKPVALAIRLFANMTAGHILLATLFMFVAQVWNMGIGIKAPVTLVSFVGAMGVMVLELFVAFLQAFVFMFLTAVFISLMDHHDEHGHEHGHDHAHGHEHAHA
jgi:F-type H+-transporting ATPase subunit a